MKILITGSSGQLGKTVLKDIKEKICNKNLKILTPTKNELDLTNIEFCKEYTKKISPDFIINCAAFTNVDNAEEELNTAKLINSYAPEAFAAVIKENNGYMIQISTDYVFKGNYSKPYKPFHERNPLNAYGMSKFLGDKAIENLF